MNRSTRPTSVFASLALVTSFLLAVEGPARAVLGVEDDRSSLPEGPGSVNGFADNAEVSVATGAMTYSLPFEVPDGFAGATPSMSLSYSSGGGNGPWGMGWSVAVPSIERGTALGLPGYTTDDAFYADGSDQLVRVDDTGATYFEYRARFENGFIRYRWHNPLAAAAHGDYWTAELPDGSIRYFGADSQGAIDTLSREQGAAGTFKYELVASVDTLGNRVHYTWQQLVGSSNASRALESVSQPILASIEYAFRADGTPRNKVVFGYEERPDAVSDCKAGFCAYLEHRTVDVSVFTGTTKIRSYQLGYDPTPVASPLSRLRTRKVTGKDGGVYPATNAFDYTQALGVGCTVNDCGMPSLVTMTGASLGADVKNGQVTLVDINGDALPDGLYTDGAGVHHFFLNQISGGTQKFVAVDSKLGGISGFKLGGAGHTQLLDLDGDGFVDLVDLTQNKLLRNHGTGDWTAIENVTIGAGNTQVASQQISSAESSDGVYNDDDVMPGYMRFLDVDNDKRPDILQAVTGSAPLYYRNLGAGGFATGVALAPIAPGNSFGFDNNGTQLADMNGDGLPDAAWVIAGSPGHFTYVLNLGNGAFSATQINITLPAAINAADTNRLYFEDLNGDDLNDVVLITGGTLHYALNVNGTQFGDWKTISAVGATALPDSTQTPLFADMNGNGSTDVVWFSASGVVTYLELFPQRPFLLSRIENGLGKIVDVTYTTSVLEQAQATTPWAYRLLHPNTMVSTLDDWDAQSNLHDVTRYHYASAFYSGTDHQFRGFQTVQTETVGDPTQEDGLAVHTYDLGVTDDYHHGLLQSSTESSGSRELVSTTNTFADCPVAGVPSSGLAFPVRHVCKTSTETIKKEGAASTDWATVHMDYAHDGYGQTTLATNLGVTKLGGGACGSCGASGDYGAACGPSCTGDEAYVETTFAQPGSAMGRWMLGKPVSVRTYADASSAVYGETLYYYDGNPFEGLPAGQVDKGLVTREQVLEEAGSYITAARSRYDAHGNLIEEISALGAPDASSHRTLWVHDADGLELVREVVLLDGANGPYHLWRDYSYDPSFLQTATMSSWYVATGGSVANGVLTGGTAEGAIFTTGYTYDQFGRQTSIIEPGDDPSTPGEAFTYQVGSPVSVMTATGRSKRNGTPDAQTIQCFDGHSRLYQERTKLDDTHYTVTGYTVFNVRKEPVRVYEPYTSTSAACDTAEPANVPMVTYLRDSAARPLATTRSDASVYGADSVLRHQYLPLARVDLDAEDTDAASPHANTPTVRRFDGLGRLVAVERHLKAGDAGVTHRIVYDALGNFRGYLDPEGNRRTQDYDRMGSVLRIQDPIRGARVLAYDDDRNVVSETDGRGIKTSYAYDGLDRVSAIWKDGDEVGTRVEYTHDRPGACPAAQCSNVGARLVGASYPLDGGEHGQDYLGYDDRGNQTRLRRSFHGHDFDFAYAYDDLRRRTGTTYPNGKTLPYSLDGAGRVTKIDTYLKSLSYDDRGDAKTMVYGNGVTTTYEHDALRQLHHVTVTDATNQAIVDLVTDRDREGHIVKVTDNVTTAGVPSHAMELTYDSLYRVATATLDKDRADLREDLTFTHSPAGNLTSKVSSLADKSAAHVGAYTYDATNTHKLMTAGHYTLGYDAAGNTTSHTDGEQLSWDHRGRLTDIAHGGETTAHFEYGASDVRVSKRENGSTTLYVTPDYEVRDGDAQIYVTVGDRQLARIEYTDTAAKLLTDIAPATLTATLATPQPDGLITSGDAWIAQLAATTGIGVAGVTPSSVDDLLAAAARRLLAGQGTEIVTYYTHDAVGSFIHGTDGTGKTVARLVQHPFGTRRWSLGGAPEDLRFAGKEIDASGLAYYGARYAHVGLGRWVSPDPEFDSVTNPAAFDTPDQVSGAYLFLDGDPVNQSDDDGRFAHAIFGAVFGGVAGVVSSLVNDLLVAPSPDLRSGDPSRRRKARFAIVRNAVLKGVIGAGVGALTGGVSGISTISATVTQFTVYKYKLRTLEERTNLYLHDKGLERSDTNLAAAREQVVSNARRSANRWALGVGLVTGAAAGFGHAAATGAGALHFSSIQIDDKWAGTAVSQIPSALSGLTIRYTKEKLPGWIASARRDGLLPQAPARRPTSASVGGKR